MFVFILGACLKLPAQSLETNGEKWCRLSSDWSVCLGQDVLLLAQHPKVLLQHPRLANPKGEDSIQNYIVVGEQQLVVLSGEPNPCAGSFFVNGVLQQIDLGGAPGTEDSYQNYYLSGTRFLCR